ncbi:MAG: aminomethyl-transferring glycine dehydrogenase subunit GcvPA [Calditrichaceae bacterium]|nr:aminomethyl-transferring glycine dehydrogenase subunit GcvPA [Calditrichaceae bacterium]MBN2709024.1 aminomethyl-transferring glycine dehydrogenase subunit GcvPA [Calditrichaceae bacterium]RQV95324.1 MAG: aminomethyl-transferring glycine dehydrogenase subunit GcvPA [Calditrichota bacterium]
MAYLSNSEKDVKQMLKTIGVNSFDDLIKNIPQALRFKNKFNIPEAVSEYEISRIMQDLSGKNTNYISFMGGGTYDHYVPAIVESLISRSEFYTSYTPYQPEVSQGNLQAIYEFQSMVCELTQMDVTNASMYEAGSALAEAVLLALNHTGKNKVLIPSTLNPRYKMLISTYIANMDITMEEIPADDFTMDINSYMDLYDEQVGAVVIQNPNYFGFLEDIDTLISRRGSSQAMFIMVYNPISLGLLKTPGEYGMDIAVAEGQVLGNQQNYGGPYVGLFSVNEKLVRKIPGRISGITKDIEGRQGFVLTLQTREQHIRRDKATSNICTNSGLMALAAGIYLATIGKAGIRGLAELCLQKAHYLADNLLKINKVQIAGKAPFFNEFTVKLPVKAQKVVEQAKGYGIMPGINLDKSGYEDHLLIAVTEKRTREEMDLLIDCVKEAVLKG